MFQHSASRAVFDLELEAAREHHSRLFRKSEFVFSFTAARILFPLRSTTRIF